MRRSSRSRDAGSAAVEVLVLGVLLLVPLVYLVLTVAALQGAAFAAEGAARQAARTIALASTDGEGRRAADAAIEVALADWRIEPGATTVQVDCAPVPGDCITPRGTVEVHVRVAAALPLLPPAVIAGAPGTIPVDATALQHVSMFAAVP
jgi:hypothetical protein